MPDEINFDFVAFGHPKNALQVYDIDIKEFKKMTTKYKKNEMILLARDRYEEKQT